jgi:hypothetical protein
LNPSRIVRPRAGEALARREFFDTAGIQMLERIADALSGDDAIDCDFGKRHEHEGAFE